MATPLLHQYTLYKCICIHLSVFLPYRQQRRLSLQT